MANTNCNPTQKPTGTITSFTRNHYFYGKLLTVSDFRLEQNYFIDKIRLKNQLLEGKGIIDGLEIENLALTSDPENIKFTLTAGHAIDADGNIMLVNNTRVIEILNDATDKKNFYICIEYDECEQDSVPIASDDSQCEEEGCCYNRIREKYNLKIVDTASPCIHTENCTIVPEMNTDDNTETNCIVLAVVTGGSVNENQTKQYRCTIKSNQALQDMLCNHINADNPHNVVTSINDLKSDVTLSTSDAITLIQNEQSITVGETHSANEDNPHKVTARQLKALTKLTSKDNSVTIAKTQGNPTTLDLKVKSTNNENIAILEKYLRERALKCTVTSFKMVAERFDDKVKKVALDIVENAKKAVDGEMFNDIDKFTSFIDKELIEFYKNFIDSLRGLDIQISNMEMLEKVVKGLSNSKNITKKAALMDEVCFYVLQLEPTKYSESCKGVLRSFLGPLKAIADNFKEFKNIVNSANMLHGFIESNIESGICDNTPGFRYFIKDLKYLYLVQFLSQLSSANINKDQEKLTKEISNLNENTFILDIFKKMDTISGILNKLKPN